MSENGEIYTAGKNFTLPPAVTAWTNSTLDSIFDSILLYPRINSQKSADSIQKIIQFNSQGIIDTGRIGKVPNDCPKSVQIRQKGGFSSKMANIDQSRCQLLKI